MMKTRFPVPLIILMFACVLMCAFHLPAFAEDVDDAQLKPRNGIPLLIIRVNEENTSIADMNSSPDHSVRCNGKVQIKVPAGYAGEFGAGSAVVPAGELNLTYIRGRGNSTWSIDPGRKKPYKIRFKKEQNLFGMGASRDWALMANDFDDTLMKNRIVAWLGEKMGFDYTPQMVPVDVVMIGSKSGMKQLGSYCLSEMVSCEAGRLDTHGGPLLAIYTESQNDGSAYFTTGGGIDIMFDTPKNRNEQAVSFVNDLEQMITSPDSIDAAGHAAIADKMDMKSTADYWWIQEFTCNDDGYATSSNYMYIDPTKGNANGRLFWGPLWDFDIVFSSNPKTDPDGKASGFNNTEMLWIDQLRYKDPAFRELLINEWRGTEGRPGLNYWLTELTRNGGWLDHKKSELSASWNQNYRIWQNSYDPSQEKESNFNAAVEKVRSWIVKRQAWINAHIDKVGQIYNRITYTADGKEIGHELVREGRSASQMPEAPDKAGYLFAGWQDKESGEKIENIKIINDMTFEAVYIREDEAVKPSAVYFSRTEDWADLKQGEYWDNSLIVFPEDAISPEVRWNSSNESAAVVEKDGTVRLVSAGDTRITATLYNGVTGSYLLHVYDSDKVTPVRATGITARPKTLTLKPGQTEQITYALLPQGRTYADYQVVYEAEDSECIDFIDSAGIVTGLKPGRATVSIHLITLNDDDDEADNDMDHSDQCVVIVADDSQGSPGGDQSDKSQDGSPSGDQSDKSQDGSQDSSPGGDQSDNPQDGSQGSSTGDRPGSQQALLPAPVIKTKAKAPKKMQITWSKIPGAKGYRLSYREANSRKWKNKEVKGAKTTKTTIKNIKKGKLYQFKLAAVDSKGKTGKSSKVSLRYYKGIQGVKAKAGKKAIHVSWKKVKGADGYQILISEKKSPKKPKLITIRGNNKTSRKIAGLKKGKTYYVAVRPFKQKGKDRYIGIRSSFRRPRPKKAPVSCGRPPGRC